MLRGILICLFFIISCSSAKVDEASSSVPPAPITNVPQDIPENFQSKFEVTEGGIAEPPAFDLDDEEKTQATPSKAIKKKAVKPKPAPLTFQIPNRRPAIDPLVVGEKHVFDITYLAMSAGEFTMNVLPYKAISGRKSYHIQGRAISSKVFSIFYRLDDMVESFIDYEGFYSHRLHLLQDESKQWRDSLELNDHEKGETFFWNRWNHKVRGYVETKATEKMERFSQDSLSALYYVRTIPLPAGATIKFPVVSEGKNWDAEVHVIRREIMKTPMGEVYTVVLRPEMKFQGVLTKKGDSYLWLTDDDRRIIVRLEAKVKIGSVIVDLKEYVPGSAQP